MLETYRAHVAQRLEDQVPALPLNAEQVRELCTLLESPPSGEEGFLRELLLDRIPPGVDPAAQVKADWLGAVAEGTSQSPLVSPTDAIEILGQMMGGYNVPYLVRELAGPHAALAAETLSGLTMVFDNFEVVKRLHSEGNTHASTVLRNWADATWFTSAEQLPDTIEGVIYKADGETNTDDLSPAPHASSRPDIPLHANVMYESSYPDCVPYLREQRATGKQVIMVGDVYGTGSSRKSATNSLLWWIGQDIPHVPNKRTRGVLIADSIAPIFLNTMRDAGGLPIQAAVESLATGQEVVIDTVKGEVRNAADGAVLTTFTLNPNTLRDEYRAGGRVPLIVGRALTMRAREALGLGPSEAFTLPAAINDSGKGYSLAQKMVGKACGVTGVRPGMSVEPKMTTVGSQDTTGPMTADEMKELACLSFNADLVMQSFCHTAAYPKEVDVKMHRWLPQFMVERNGVALRPGDGIIHSWLNRMLLPDTVGTGGDSHTRFPIGISFPAGSGLVAFAAALGMMPLDMPESVLVRFKGELQPGITLRDLVNAIPWVAMQSGDLTVDRPKKNVFAGRILEIEGLEHLTAEQAFELSDASAERSAAACAVNLSEDSVADYLRSNIELLEAMIADGYGHKDTIRRRIDAMQAWLDKPELLRADGDAEYAAVYEIDLATITEPIVACPNDPDKVALLSEVAGNGVDEVFVGSCMTNIGHFRATANVLKHSGAEYVTATTWICPPTRMDELQLQKEGHYGLFGKMGCRREIPGCSLCMGNQARVRPGATVFSTSTRNFNNRMGRDAQVYLGSAELAATIALLGRIPTVDEYRDMMAKCVNPFAKDIYRYLDFRETNARVESFAVGADSYY
ncbi:MAG: bifunctional aconitate hydratase 2/2-methylisocitrate dehydratase [Planctomycetota bacterium]|nr:MAG: bifunctional aconitate hydratase 2/2-methylisocitrate dehydratase [Planctomycetota bacterium]